MDLRLRISIFLLIIPIGLIAQTEICDNGIDDDNDNLIDLNDPDCDCEVVEAISFIPNPSFEDQNCCPDDRSQLDCATDWIQASEPTTDYIHTCNWLGWDQFPPPQPFPDGEGIMGFRDGRVRGNNDAEPFWKEYAGACLLSPLLKDSSYKFQFDVGFVDPQSSPPIDISFFGTTDCINLPFGVGNQAFGCPSNDPTWEKLAEITVSGGSGDIWVNTFLDIIPDKDINAIAIGPDCNPISSNVSLYYFFDNLLLANFESFNLLIKETAHPCSPDFSLFVPNNADFEYQWYLNGVALQGEEFSELSQNYGEGFYQVRIVDGSSCKVSTEFEYRIPEFIEPDFIAICEGDFYEFGDLQLTEPGSYIDTFLTDDNCNIIVELDLEVVGLAYDTIAVTIFEGETYEYNGYTFSETGDYPLVLQSTKGCDSLVLLKVSTFNIYVPNIFSPNDDFINDIFFPFASEIDVDSYKMRIYDRWGNEMYEGQEWDGSEAQSGVYSYIINFQFKNGDSKMIVGDVTLIR